MARKRGQTRTLHRATFNSEPSAWAEGSSPLP